MVMGFIELRLHLDSVFIWSWQCVLYFESVESGIGGIGNAMIVLGIGKRIHNLSLGAGICINTITDIRSTRYIPSSVLP